MKPYYWKSDNFGDHINTWIWKEIFPTLVDENDDVSLVGIGSILRSEIGKLDGSILICGTGAGYGNAPSSKMANDWKFYFVRGPLTCKVMGLHENLGVIDGAWLISMIDEFKSIPDKKGTIFVPHWSSAICGVWEYVCEQVGIKYIDPLSNSKDVIHAIGRSELAIVEAMHGAIIADYYRTPWIPVRISDNILSFKWIDWCSSINVEYTPTFLPPSDFIDCIIRNKNPFKKFENRVFPLITPEALTIARSEYLPNKISIKNIPLIRNSARFIREKFLSSLMYSRNFSYIYSWNEKYIEELSSRIKLVENSKAFLSEDILRLEKIELLNKFTHKLSIDFNS